MNEDLVVWAGNSLTKSPLPLQPFAISGPGIRIGAGEPTPMHPERRALLDAVIASPADDLPRLVFADWLDEHGESERAEFVRVHVVRGLGPFVGLAGKAMSFAFSPEVGCHVRAGEAGSVVLLPAVAGIVGVADRGFIDELRGPLAALLSHGPAIARDHPLESVSVTDRRAFKSGGNDSYYIGNFDPMPSRTWNRLEDHPSPKAAMDSLNAAVLAEIRRRLK